jgi:hypothetical protein
MAARVMTPNLEAVAKIARQFGCEPLASGTSVKDHRRLLCASFDRGGQASRAGLAVESELKTGPPAVTEERDLCASLEAAIS